MTPVHTCKYGFKELSTKGICLQKYSNLQKGDQEVFSIVRSCKQEGSQDWT